MDRNEHLEKQQELKDQREEAWRIWGLKLAAIICTAVVVSVGFMAGCSVLN